MISQSVSGGGPERIGLLTAARHVQSFAKDPLLAVQKMFVEHGPLIEIDSLLLSLMSSRKYLLAIGPKYNEAVLGRPDIFRTSGLMIKGPDDSSQRHLSAGLVAMNGAKHQHYRKMLLSPLRRARVDGMVAPMAQIIDEELDSWPLGETVDFWPLISNVAQHVAVALLFKSSELGSLAYAQETANIINAHLQRSLSPKVYACPVNFPGTPYHDVLRQAEKSEDHIVSWAKKRNENAPSEDLISLVLNRENEGGGKTGDKEIAGHVFTLFGATYETCQSVLTWTLFMLAQHPSACASLLDEIESMTLEGPDLAERIDGCRWLDDVMKEGLRILPPVPFQIRQSVHETDIDGLPIKRNTRVVLSPFLTNRLPDLYPEGNRFKPGRWSAIDPSQYEYLVFSAGPRTCIGYRFATNFLKVAIAKILQRYRFSVVEGADVNYHVRITVGPRNGIPVIIQRQDRSFRASEVKGNIHNVVRF